MLQNAFWKGRAPSGETVELCISLRRLVGDVGLSQRGSNLSRPQPEFQTVLPWVLAVDPPQDLRLLYWAKTPSGSAQDLNVVGHGGSIELVEDGSLCQSHFSGSLPAFFNLA